MTKPCVIFDLDGTLADVRHRLHHVRKRPPDWPAFFDACVDDTPHEYVIQLNSLIDTANNARDVCGFRPDGWEWIEVFVCSGRPETHRLETMRWLSQHGVEYDVLMMRAAGDHRPDVVVKKEMLDGIRGQGYEPLFAVDDRPGVVQMWRDNDVPCLACDDAEWREPQAHAWAGDLEGKTLLTIMVGPSHSGKTDWLHGSAPFYLLDADKHLVLPSDLDIDPAHVLSSDQFRVDMLGDESDQSKNHEVFAALHSVAKARLDAGLPTVIDATHLRRKDRLAAADLAPRGTRVRYVVVDRPIEAKLASRRPNFPESVVRKHDQTFRSQLKDILAGDGRSDVDVVDLRS